jgi:hypothetical protein
MNHSRLLSVVPGLMACALGAADADPALGAADADPAPAAGQPFSASVALLMQQFTGTSEDYAVKEKGIADDNDGTVESLEAGYAPGVRVALAYLPSGSAVSYGLDVTYHVTDIDDSVSDAADLISGTQIAPELSADIGEEDIGKATAEQRTDLLKIALLLHHDRSLGERVGLSLSGGLTYVSFKNEREYNYYDDTTPGPGEDHVVVKREQDFSGFGLTMDAALRVQVGNGFSVLGGTGMSLLSGNSDLSLSETEPDDGAVNVDMDMDVAHVVPVLRASIGVGWQRMIAGSDLSIDLLYEYEAFIGLVRDITYTDDVNDVIMDTSGDLAALHGLALRGMYSF